MQIKDILYGKNIAQVKLGLQKISADGFHLHRRKKYYFELGDVNELSLVQLAKLMNIEDRETIKMNALRDEGDITG